MLTTLKTNKDRHFQDALKRALDGADEALPENIRVRLRAARKRALATQTGRHAEDHIENRWQRWLTPAAGLAAVAVITVVVTLWLGTAPESNTVASGQDLELLLASDSLELYANLDFFTWLDATHAS